MGDRSGNTIEGRVDKFLIVVWGGAVIVSLIVC